MFPTFMYTMYAQRISKTGPILENMIAPLCIAPRPNAGSVSIVNRACICRTHANLQPPMNFFSNLMKLLAQATPLFTHDVVSRSVFIFLNAIFTLNV